MTAPMKAMPKQNKGLKPTEAQVSAEEKIQAPQQMPEVLTPVDEVCKLFTRLRTLLGDTNMKELSDQELFELATVTLSCADTAKIIHTDAANELDDRQRVRGN